MTTRTLAERLFGPDVPHDPDDENDDVDSDTGDDEDDDNDGSGGAEATATSSDRTHAQILFGSDDAAPPGRGVEQYLSGRLDDNIGKLADAGNWTTEQQAAEKRMFSTLTLTELGLERHDAFALHDAWTEARLAGTSDARTEQSKQWAAQSRRELRERFGSAEAESLMRRLHEYAEAHPALQEVLANGVGSHPKIVSLFVEHIRRVGRQAV